MKKTLYMIGNGHIDPVWLWQWPEGFQEIKATFRSALDRLQESDDFLFVASSAAFYAWIEENEPEMFEEIRQRVAEKRWELLGGWWVEPDCNLPSAESFVRQALLAQRFFQERFGVIARVGFNPDSFGHHGMLPQLLRKSGLTSYVFMRPGPHEKGLPGNLFWWEADDGSRVLTARIPFDYCTPPEELEQHVLKCAGELKEPFVDLMCFYGVGNHGGGPTKKNLASIRRMQQREDLPELVLSTPGRFFADVAAKGLAFPVVHDELQFHAIGCYSAHSGVKAENRRVESLLVGAERLASVAWVEVALPYPAELTRAWKNVLFNQFHDILAGTSLEQAYVDARDEYGEAAAIAKRAQNAALQRLTWRIDIPAEDGMKPIVVWNPHAWASRVNVELEYGQLKDTDVLVDEQGAQVALQSVTSGATVKGWRKRLSFTVELPSLGYRTLRVLPRAGGQHFASLVATEQGLENERFRIELDPSSGFIAGVLDKASNVQVLRAPAQAVVIEDTTDTWSHGIVQYRGKTEAFTTYRISVVEQGPVKAVVRVESRFGDSRLLQDICLHAGLDRIEVRVALEWRERFKVLKLRFPTALHFPKATYEIPFGHVERPVDGLERPGQTWVDLSGVYRPSGELHGMSLLNDGKSSFDVDGTDLGMTVVRSPIYAHHDPLVPDPAKDYRFMDQGWQHFTYALLPHRGGWEGAGTVQQAAELNQRPVTLLETYHAGSLPQRASFLEVDAPNIVVTALKRSEDGDALVLRAFEAHRVACTATFRFPRWNRVFEAQFGACEIKTFRIPVDAAEPVVELDLIERALGAE